MLRKACKEHAGQGHVFNTFLEKLAEKCKLDSGHSKFWQEVVSKGITLLTEMEAEGAGVTKEEAQRWLQQHLGVAKVATSAHTQAKRALAQSCLRLLVRLLHLALGVAPPSQHEVLVLSCLHALVCCADRGGSTCRHGHRRV